jgi:hypothetical protein
MGAEFGVSKPTLSKIVKSKLTDAEEADERLQVQLHAVMKKEEEDERLQVQLHAVMKKEEENERLQVQLGAVMKHLASVSGAKAVDFEALAKEPAGTPLEEAAVADAPEVFVADVLSHCVPSRVLEVR